VLKEIRERIGKTFGDEIEVILEEDTEPRRVEVPDDFRQALAADPAALAAFQRLSYTHQRETVQSILDAKRAETRQNRISKSVELLRQT
jgi:uncharacterized protein YdeI (YjbR/CyaY-like superfamily)